MAREFSNEIELGFAELNTDPNKLIVVGKQGQPLSVVLPEELELNKRRKNFVYASPEERAEMKRINYLIRKGEVI
jgi:hypothetical protein